MRRDGGTIALLLSEDVRFGTPIVLCDGRSRMTRCDAAKVAERVGASDVPRGRARRASAESSAAAMAAVAAAAAVVEGAMEDAAAEFLRDEG